jgi:hypothetical protein
MGMAKLIRGKVIAGLREAFSIEKLFIRGDPAHAEVAFKSAIRQAYRHRWVVNVEAPDGRPQRARQSTLPAMSVA